MWRARSLRARPRLIEVSEDEAQRLVLDLVLARHPEPVSYPALASGVAADPGEVADALALAIAVRDLALAGLLCSDGVRVAPTRPALAFARLPAPRRDRLEGGHHDHPAGVVRVPVAVWEEGGPDA